MLLEGAAERLRRLAESVEPHLLSADTYGTADAVAAQLGVPLPRISHGEAKRRYVKQLGAERCAAIGNGSNDAAMFKAAAVSLAIVGPEGVSMAALEAADVVCGSIAAALDLLCDPLALVATLRP
jgi:P-type E1-E2 ATPase